MSDETREQDNQGQRQPMADPRLQREERQLTMGERAAVWAGWASGLGVIVLLFWMAITDGFGLGPKIVAGVTIALFVFWVVTHRQSIVATVSGRGTRLGTNSVAFVLLMLGILIMVNYISSRRFETCPSTMTAASRLSAVWYCA